MNQSAEQSQQVEVAPPTGSPEPLTMFFAVGILINLALIRQWKKPGKTGSSNPEE